MHKSNPVNAPILWLASASPQRVCLLAQIAIVPDKICPANIDESPHKGERPRQYAARMAAAKARKIMQSNKVKNMADIFILAADTVISIGRDILPKAQTRQIAQTCLMRLSGRSHRVHTGLCLHYGGREIVKIVTTRVQMKRLADYEQTAYLDSDEWQDKAGGYAIQGRAAGFIRAIQGSYANIIGLPLYETSMLLQGAGYISPMVDKSQGTKVRPRDR